MRDGAQLQDLQRFHTDFHLLDAYSPRTPGGTGETFDWELARRHPRTPPVVLSGGLDAGQRRRGDRAGAAVRGRRGQRHGGRARAQGPGQAEGVRARGRGRRRAARGGRVSAPGDAAALRPLRRALRARDADPRARRARARVARGALGPGLHRRARRGCCATTSAARRRSTAPRGCRRRSGREVWLKREDLTHTGSHKINNALGQALLARRMGKPRVIAETGAGQHGVASATACALLGLECIVYMGTEDMRRQRPNVERMRLLGAEVVGVEAGARTLKEAVSAAIRDWVANVESTHYVIGSAVGPAPYPALVRDLQRTIGDEARAQVLEAAGRLPDRVIACVGGGSNAIGTFAGFVDDAGVELIGVEAAGEGLDTLPPLGAADHRRARRAARRAVGGAPGRGGADPRGALDLGRARLSRASAPSTRTCATAAGSRYVAVSDARRAGRVPAGGRARGDPAGARAGARARLGAGQPGRGSDSARRSIDAVGPRRQGPGRGARARGGVMSVAATGRRPDRRRVRARTASAPR